MGASVAIAVSLPWATYVAMGRMTAGETGTVATSGAQNVTAGVPFIEHDATASLVCIANHNVSTLPPFVVPR